MKYKLAQFLLQKEIDKAKAGKVDDTGTIMAFKKDEAGNPASQFKYCWQSNINSQLKGMIKFPREK